MGGLWNTGCAGGTGGCGEPWLQGTKNVLRVETIESDIRVARMAAIAYGAVDGKGSIPVLQLPDERIALASDPRALLEGRAADKEFGGGTHANAERHRHRAGTQSRLLPTAVDQRLYSVLQIAANIQGADALRSVRLVSRKADHIRMYSQIAHIHGARCLRRIAMQQNAVGCQQCGNARDVLNRPDFVVHRHCGNGQNASVKTLFERTEVDESFAVNWNGLNRESLMHGKPPGGGQDAFVLDSAHEDTPPSGCRATRQTKQGEVVGFGAPEVKMISSGSAPIRAAMDEAASRTALSACQPMT